MPYTLARLRSLAGLALSAALSLGLLAGAVQAQGESPSHYFRGRQFSIPFSMDAGRPVRAFHLHASTDGVTYTEAASAAPGDRQFTYTAREDGWYYFIVQVEEPDGRRTPRNVGAAPVGLRICVDTVKPAASLKPVSPRTEDGGTVAVEWEVRDTNLDLRTLQLQFAAQGSERWTTLRIRQLEHAQFSWAPAGSGPFDVRLRVSDLAGNTTTVVTRVAPGRVLEAGAGSLSIPVSGRIKHVKSRTFNLTYKTLDSGPSGVKVEVYWTRDTKVWSKYLHPDRPGADATAPAQGPYQVKVPTSGQYGFTLRAVSGVGRGMGQPVPGEQPQVWIVVDDKSPQVKVKEPIRVSEDAEGGHVTIEWEAADDNFPDRPINLYQAETPTGPWTLVPDAKEIANSGSFRCPATKLPPKFYVKVEAVDNAGNRGEAVTKNLTTVDLKTPKIDQVDVTGESTEGFGNPAMQ